MVWGGRDLSGSSSSTPCNEQGHLPLHQSPIQAALHVSRDGGATTSLGNLFHCFTTLILSWGCETPALAFWSSSFPVDLGHVRVSNMSCFFFWLVSWLIFGLDFFFFFGCCQLLDTDEKYFVFLIILQAGNSAGSLWQSHWPEICLFSVSFL